MLTRETSSLPLLPPENIQKIVKFEIRIPLIPMEPDADGLVRKTRVLHKPGTDALAGQIPLSRTYIVTNTALIDSIWHPCRAILQIPHPIRTGLTLG